MKIETLEHGHLSNFNKRLFNEVFYVTYSSHFRNSRVLEKEKMRLNFFLVAIGWYMSVQLRKMNIS